MSKSLLAGILIVLTAVSPAYALQIEGVDMPDTLTVGGDQLVLNGAGVRHKFFMDLYVGGLYLQQKSQEGQAVVDADAPMAIVLHITSGMITEKKMADATKEGFESTLDGNTQPMQKEIDVFVKEFSQDIKTGDVYELAYLPGKGVTVTKNGKEGVTIQGGLAFKKALFGIWVGPKATVNKSLNDGMLGRE